MKRKLIEQAFPLKKVSEDSKHEKNVRHGHISTLHIWPARRPLAACRAVTIAALLDDPADADPEIQTEYRKVTGTDDPEQQRAKLCEMIGAITRWKSENGPNLQTFKDLIRKTYHGAAPKVLDPFAGGGAIPLEAMRLGCEVTANDYNPVAWFLLKCTLDYPQRFAGKTLELPKLDLPDELQVKKHVGQHGTLADHVELWGHWVFNEVRKAIGEFYPVINNQPTVAYLWARTVPCQDPHCGATVPLLKTLWLCNKTKKLRALKMQPNFETKQVDFEVYAPQNKQDVAEPTMAKAKSTCPLCGTLLTKEHIKQCGFEKQMHAQMTCVVYDTPKGKEYRPPTPDELAVFARLPEALAQVAHDVPLGIPNEPLPGPEVLGMRVPLYGFTTWADLFTDRQLLAGLTFVKYTHQARQAMQQFGYAEEWIEAISAYLAVTNDRLVNFNSTICFWDTVYEKMGKTFARYALPMTWDFDELNIFSLLTGGFLPQLSWVIKFLSGFNINNQISPSVIRGTATELNLTTSYDSIITDPPYYDAIPYSDVSDFFYVWLKRNVGDIFTDFAFNLELTPKSEELVAHQRANEHNQIENSPKRLTKDDYESGMAKAFQQITACLSSEGIVVIVFSNKNPEAWETLSMALIKAGLLITGSWPIDTEMTGALRNYNRASLSSSVWIVCRKRPANAGIGRYKAVMQQMKERITDRLRYFWDQGIHGPDFVWSALGPALEAYSQYQEVKRLDGSLFTVAEFLREVRRMVTDFALGRILHQHSTEGLDAWTSYYLMHRYDFGLDPAPAGECLLLAQGYMLNLDDLRGKRGLLQKAKSGNEYTLLPYHARIHDDLGEPQPSGGLPYIDLLHKLMQLWKSGNTQQRDAYAADHGLMENDLFWAMAQAVLEMCDPKGDAAERSLLEALVAWGRGKTVTTVQPEKQMTLL